ncbi:hypothetical protein VK792_00440 [Mesobacterium sp. TK19101]|uniref:Uncharacterized protein n=1 Tax=Mesobacterium hydrothermale TaxID=3111907 RepID=A0ABU6HD12_9RHOB|nr:hypothetical protein [Mesobacterium sp. TK19101]MEC3859735.1 hypothetical protein [Mesobacterium sp. TK19101]
MVQQRATQGQTHLFAPKRGRQRIAWQVPQVGCLAEHKWAFDRKAMLTNLFREQLPALGVPGRSMIRHQAIKTGTERRIAIIFHVFQPLEICSFLVIRNRFRGV